ncbi:jacalin-related lectin 34-like [Cornus florida]|uniref:jacalin-related lectin 34-like n=1 Tax=Cornus florida TaxID=4283 RepID=UPI0028A17E17|nr:jacalin-related lectin 34-like [Cornus florida]
MAPNHPRFGPFGAQVGNEWNDGTHNDVRKIKIRYGEKSVIYSIQFQYLNRKPIWNDQHGENGGDQKEALVEFQQNEHIESIWGYYSSNSGVECVQSLTIKSTSEQTWGPYGTEKGKYFKIPSTRNCKIVGFFGWSGDYLYSLGALFHLSNAQFIRRKIVGPLGGYSGVHWDDGIHSGVKKITIWAEEFVKSIQIEYSGNSGPLCTHGEITDGNPDPIPFNEDNGYLVSIEGFYNSDSAIGAIQSLTFHTSTGESHGPFGTEIGKHFKFPSPASSKKIIGLHGRSGPDHLESIGAYYEPADNFTPVGPEGGKGGIGWDDGNQYSAVRQLIIHSDHDNEHSAVINSIQIEYDDEFGISEWCKKHGGESKEGTKPTKFILDHDEYLTSIGGIVRQYGDVDCVVCSLTFQTNKKTFSTVGVQGEVNSFELSENGKKIIGFHGRSGDWLDSIGAHLGPI